MPRTYTIASIAALFILAGACTTEDQSRAHTELGLGRESLHIFSTDDLSQTLRGTDNDDVFFVASPASPEPDDPIWLQKRTARGGDGNDYLHGRPGQDIFFGGAHTDLCKLGFGSAGDDPDTGDATLGDRAELGDGVDLCVGGGGSDEIRGGADGDLIYGHRGNDSLFGGTGDDLLRGGDGDDLIVGGPGRDVMIGDEGADMFRVGPMDLPSEALEILLDYRPDEGDILSLPQGEWVAEDTPAGALFTLSNGGALLVVDTEFSEIAVD